MAGQVQQFRLRWNNHQPNFISVFTDLLNSESLVDVTLGAEGKHVQAHKVVLSACSSYFQTLFTVNPCQHPIVILKDVKYNELKVIVDFMYYGEVNVSQEQLPAILKTAEMLKVKGLAEMPEQMSKSRSLSSDKGDEVATPPGDNASVWGSDSVRHSPSPQPMSPAMRRKRLRKTSTGSGSGSTERTSERNSEEHQSMDINVVKAEPTSFHSEADSGSLRNSLQEVSTESEPPDCPQENADDPNNIHSSQENAAIPAMDTHPGPSAIYNYGPGKVGTKRTRLLMRQSRIKKDCDSSQPVVNTPPDSEDPSSPQPLTPLKAERQSSEPISATQPASPSPCLSPCSTREGVLQRDNSRDKITTVTVSTSGGSQLTVPGVKIERQCSDPKSQTLSPTHQPQPSQTTMTLLGVPSGYLVKQHSHPNLPSHSSTPLVSHTISVQRQHSHPTRLQPQHHTMPSLSLQSIESDSPPCSTPSVDPGLGSSSTSISPALVRVASDPASTLRVRSEELRRSTSSPQSSTPLDLGTNSASASLEPARSGHCPVERDGPALGCNYCWNTIDTHGRTLRRKTKFHCPECKTNLCIVPCFQEYHERQSSKEPSLNTPTTSGNSINSSMVRLLPKTSSV